MAFSPPLHANEGGITYVYGVLISFSPYSIPLSLQSSFPAFPPPHSYSNFNPSTLPQRGGISIPVHLAILKGERDMPLAANEEAAALRRSNSAMTLRSIVPRALRTTSVKNLFKHRKPRHPVEIVCYTRALLVYLESTSDDAAAYNHRHDEKLEQLDLNMRELKSILYGINDCEPVPETCAQLTQEFFTDDTMRLLVHCLPKLNFEARKDATQIVANLQRQPVHSRLIASDYWEANLDLISRLIIGYEDPVNALLFGGMLKESIRHQVVAKFILSSQELTKKFFKYIELPNFDVASEAAATFKELMTRHKSTVAEFLTQNFTWFFTEFNTKLMGSPNYMTRRHAVKLLGEMLLDRSNSSVMIRYVSSKSNLMVLMNLMRESHRNIQIDAFHVFKLFVTNKNKPPDIVNILYFNKSKLLRFMDGFCTDKEDEVFAADKAEVMKQIMEVEAVENCSCSGELFKPMIV